MAGGRGKINEYNKSLTPEQRKNNARRAAQAKRPRATLNSNIKNIARMINEAPANSELKEALSIIGLKDEEFSNAAGIALAVYQAAINGDMKAVEKWEKYVGQYEREPVSKDEVNAALQKLDDMIGGFKRAIESETDGVCQEGKPPVEL